MFQFGIGGMYANPNGGNLATPSGPQRFGTIQDVSVEFDQKLVELMGQNKMPDDVAPSDMKISGKGGFGNIEIDIYNALFFADTIVTGSNQVSQDEPYTVATQSAPSAWVASTMYTLGQLITADSFIFICLVAGTSGSTAPTWVPTAGTKTTETGGVVWGAVAASSVTTFIKVANAGTFVEDLSVRYASSNVGTSLKPVVTAPAVGQYSCYFGVYIFNASDIGNGVLVTYEFVTPAGGNQGKTLTATNHIQGYGPTFELFLVMPYMGNNCLHLHKCRSSKMSAPLKRDGYVISDFEFMAYPDSSGVAFDWFQLGS
jgi:hypothetical protein